MWGCEGGEEGAAATAAAAGLQGRVNPFGVAGA